MYTYNELQHDLAKLNRLVCQCYTIGQIGEGPKKLMLNGAHHGLEYITAAFLMKFILSYSRHFLDARDFFGWDIDQLFQHATLYVIPMVNPDGVDIAVNGLDITNPYHRRLISEAGIHSFSKVWQANAHGVDLNHNYDAHWEMLVEQPAPTKYGGLYPEDQPETKAVADFIRLIQPDMLLAFHSQGQEIYYDFNNIMGDRARTIADLLAQDSGYQAASPQGTASFGGCKDWFIQEWRRPGFTIELGKGKNPLPDSELEKLYQEGGAIICRAISLC